MAYRPKPRKCMIDACTSLIPENMACCKKHHYASPLDMRLRKGATAHDKMVLREYWSHREYKRTQHDLRKLQ